MSSTEISPKAPSAPTAPPTTAEGGTPKTPELRKLEQKWTKQLIAAGYAAVPNVIILRQRAFGLDSVDLNILLQLICYWWDADKLPFPSKATLAQAIGCHQTTIRRRLQKMEAGGLIKRIPRKSAAGGNSSNQYDLAPLIAAAQPYAQEELQRIEDTKAEKMKRLSRKKAKEVLASISGKENPP
jgi:predicted transcriptional regulator